MRVLSLFDGISGARAALDKLGITPTAYYASEIDKYVIQISKKNYPEIIQVGDVTQVNGSDYKEIDLMIWGSPCQDLSVAGKQKGLDGERSGLFFEALRILKEVKPKYFLMENVKMKKEWKDLISKELGVEPIEINSKLLSGQHRVRLYWTNIPNITQPDNNHIYLKDLIESGKVDKDKSYCLDANYWKGTNLEQYLLKKRRQIVYTDSGIRKLTPRECERLQTFPDNYTEGVSNTQRYKALGNSFTVNVIAHILSFMEI